MRRRAPLRHPSSPQSIWIRTRPNARGGSITVHYDPSRRTQTELLGLVEDFDCIGARHGTGAPDSQVADLFGKALIGALAQNLAQKSVLGLVSVLR